MKKKIFIFMVMFFAVVTVCHAGTSDSNIRIEYMENTYTNLNILGKSFSNKQGYVFANDKIAYCVEPGVYILSSIYDSTPYFDVASITDEQKEKMELYAYYGYQYPNHQTRNYYLATQQLIWETLGMTDILFTTGLNRTGQVILVANEKNEILRLIKEHEKKPSFDGMMVTLKSGEEKIITDTNQVLSNYQMKTDSTEVKKEGNQIIINAYQVGKNTLNLSKEMHTETSMIYRKEHSQTLATFGIHSELTSQLTWNTEGYYIELLKQDEETKGASPVGRSLEGAVYEIKTKDGVFMDMITTDKDGFAKTKELPADVYYVKEKTPSYGYLIDEKTYVLRLDKNTKIYRMTVYETPIEKTVVIKKYLEDVDQSAQIPEANITFEITNQDTKEKITMTTNEMGVLEVSLPFGTYTVHQVNTTEQYQKVEDFTFTIDEETEDMLTFELLNQPETGTIKILKLGEAIDKQQEVPLSDVEFQLYRVYQGNEKLISTKITDKNGELVWDNLPFGDYCLKETKTKEGYVLDSKSHCFTLAGGEYKQFRLQNELYKTKLEIIKLGEKLNKIEKGQAVYEMIPLANIEFTLYEETEQKEVMKLFSDKNGKILFNGYLKPGTYYLEETNASEIYQKNEQKYYFTVDETYQLHLQFEPVIYNYLKKGTVELKKTDENQLPLRDTTFGLFDQNKKQLWKATTDDRGIIRIENLPIGDYFFRELKAKEGYVLKETFIPFTLIQNQVVTLEVTNQKEQYPNTENYVTKAKNWIIGITVAGCVIVILGMIIDKKR